MRFQLLNYRNFFELQRKKDNITENIDIKILSYICLSIIFQSLMLWKIYNDDIPFDTKNYGDSFYNILYNGIKL